MRWDISACQHQKAGDLNIALKGKFPTQFLCLLRCLCFGGLGARLRLLTVWSGRTTAPSIKSGGGTAQAGAADSLTAPAAVYMPHPTIKIFLL